MTEPTKEELLHALEWAFGKMGRPVQRLKQNADHYDQYFKTQELIARARGK